MKNYLEVLISELNCIHLILHEDIKSTSAGSGTQTNLKSSVECKPYNDQHTINGKVDEWKEIRRITHSTNQSNRKLKCAGQKSHIFHEVRTDLNS